MSYTPRYTRGDWLSICDICGRLYEASKLRKRWDGFMTCDDDWEPRQAQDFVRGVADIQTTPWHRPESQDQFVTTFCTLYTRQGIADLGTADCAQANINNNNYPEITPPDMSSIAGYAVAGLSIAAYRTIPL